MASSIQVFEHILKSTKLIKVYWNSHKRCFSVKETNQPVRHVDEIALLDAKFIVKPTGRERVRSTKRKEVHAWVTGYPVNYCPQSDGCPVYYNPYVVDEFCTASGPIHEAENVLLYCDKAGRPIILSWNPSKEMA